MQDIDEASADVPPPMPLLSIDEIHQELLLRSLKVRNSSDSANPSTVR